MNTHNCQSVKHSGFRLLLIITGVFFSYYFYGLDVEIRQQFESKHQTPPVRVYARPLNLYPDSPLTVSALTEELKAIGYCQSDSVDEPGQYQHKPNDLLIHTRAFQSWENTEPSRLVQLHFEGFKLKSINQLQPHRPLTVLRLEPQLIGQFYLSHAQERMLVRLAKVPPLLIRAVRAIADHSVTRQLVRNFYFTQERTFKRQIDEAIMAVLLKWHYSQEQILEAYLNEVYFAQSGKKAIRGLGTAARFYFNKEIQELQLAELALLVNFMIRDHSEYSFDNPWKYPEPALANRNMVLDNMTTLGIITPREAKLAQAEPLGLTKKKLTSEFLSPAFMELVRHQLRQNYQEDLRSESLQVFTTLDPLIQKTAEKIMINGLNQLEKKYRKARQLQGAMVVTSSQDGSLLALVNGKNTRQYAAFNRPIRAKQSIGSLIQPVIYLTALEQSDTYQFTSQLDDSYPQWKNAESGEIWSPKSYDFGLQHGNNILLYHALIHSYPVAPINLGRELGVSKLYETLKRLGIEHELKTPYSPSILLGGISLTPLEVTQMYQTIASGGVYIPLRAIRAVSTLKDTIQPQQIPLAEQRFEAAPIFLLNYALQQAVRKGTGHRIGKTLPSDMIVAGKTGTTKGLRTSWFAGFDSELLTVTWVRRDDYKSMGLTGSQGAMMIWAKFIQAVSFSSKAPKVPSHIKWRWVDESRLPFIVPSIIPYNTSRM